GFHGRAVFVDAVLPVDATHQVGVVAVVTAGLIHHAVQDRRAVFEVLHPSAQLFEFVRIGHGSLPPSLLYGCIAQLPYVRTGQRKVLSDPETSDDAQRICVGVCSSPRSWSLPCRLSAGGRPYNVRTPPPSRGVRSSPRRPPPG